MLRFSREQWSSKEPAAQIAEILDFLSQNPGWQSTLEIAKAVVIGKDGTKKDVNPILYQLRDDGQIIQEMAGGEKPPRWMKKEPEATDQEISEPGQSKVLKNKHAVLGFLSRGGPHGTLAIGKAVFGPAATKKNVNPILYSIEKEGLIERDQEQNWRLKQDQQNPALQMESKNMDLRKKKVEASSGILSTEQVRDALVDPQALRKFADFLTPKYSAHTERIINATLVTVCEKAGECLQVESSLSKIEMIGSRAYGTDIIGSDIDYALEVGGEIFYEPRWKALANELNYQTKGLKGCVRMGRLDISISLKEGPDLQIVPLHGEFEYDMVPYSNLVAGKKGGCSRQEAHSKLKDFFHNNSGAQDVARILKAWLVPAVKTLPKQPWSLILRHLLFREAKQSHKEKSMRDKSPSAIELLRQVVKELSSWPTPTSKSSVAMIARRAANVDEPTQRTITDALDLWSRMALEAFEKQDAEVDSCMLIHSFFWRNH